MGKEINGKVYLRAFESTDEDFIIRLRNNKELFLNTCGNTYFSSSEHSKKLLNDNLIGNHNQIYLLICIIEKDMPIGYLSIDHIDYINKKTRWGGIVIDPKFSGYGYATMAGELLLKFVFEELNMNNIYGYWLEENIASLKVSEKLGFKKDGLLREYVFKSNKYHNVYICSMLRKEYCEDHGNR